VRRLLIRPGALGDCILSLPALEYLITDFTEVWIPTPVVPLIRFADEVHGLASTGIDLAGVGALEIPPSLSARLRGFDSILSWYGANRPEFREAITDLGVPCQFHTALPPPGCSVHPTDFFAHQVGAPEGLVPHIRVESPTARDTIVIHPFSGSPRKNWPLKLYRELADRLPSRVEWTAGPDEELPEAIRFQSLMDLAYWIKGARLYIGNDSGITHLAAAIGVPTLALFGPGSPANWAPRGANATVLHTASFEELEVAVVLSAANRLLDSRQCGASSAQPAGALLSPRPHGGYV
jgi:heptosyltransferase III